ncbi:unnamed protein product [Ectocarpus sp. 12 AP-2014]
MRWERSAAPLFATCCYLWPHVCTTAPPCASAATSTTAFAASSLDGSSLRHPSPGQYRRGGGYINPPLPHATNRQRPRPYETAFAAGGVDGGEGSAAEGAATGRLALRGPVFDVLTPFTGEGEVDFTAFGDYLQFLSEAGVPTILCNGEAGEFASLTTGERKLIVEFARKTFSGTVLNHVSASALPDVTRLISHSSSKSGGGSRTVADAVLVMPPCSSFGGYAGGRDTEGGGDERGTEAFLRKALGGCQLPIFLYSAAGNPISPGLYARLCADITTVSGILDGSGDATVSWELKEALPARQLLACADRGAAEGDDPLSDYNALSVLKAGADVWVTGSSNPLPELAVRVQACVDRGDAGGAAHAQRRLSVWAKKRKGMSGVSSSAVPLVKAAVAARVPSLKIFTRPPHEDIDPKAAAEMLRWVASNDDVARERQYDHIRRVSGKLADVYQRTWKNVEVAGLEMLFRQLSASEGRLLAVLEKAKRERAELNGRSVMNASAGEARAARLLSNVLDARRRLEEDAEEALLRPGDPVSRAAATADGLSISGLRERLEEAVAVAEASQEHLSSLSGADDNDDAFQVLETRDGGEDGSGVAAPLSINAPFADGTATSASATAAAANAAAAAAAPTPDAPAAPAAATAVGVGATGAAATTDDDDGDAAGLTPSLSAAGTTASPTYDDQGGVGSNGDGTINGNCGLNGFGTIVLERQPPPQQRSDKQQQQQQRNAEPVAAKFSQGPTYDGVDYRPGASAPRYGRVPPEETFPRADGEEERRGGREEEGKQPQWRRQQQQSVSQQQQQQQQEHLHDLLHQHQHQRKINNGAPQPTPPPRQENDDAYDPFETLRMFGSTSLSPAAATPAPGTSGATINNKPTPYGNNGRSWVPDLVEAAVDDDGGGGGVAASESGGGGSGGREQRSRDGSWAATEPPKENTRRKSLPKPRYGRAIPQGLPPKTPSKLSPDLPFQGSPQPLQFPSLQPPTSSVPQHFVPYPGSSSSSSSSNSGSSHQRGDSLATPARGAAESKQSIGGGGERYGVEEEEAASVRRRAGWTTGLREGGLTKKLGAAVDAFREREKETFFKSKGIEGDVDSFDWDELRRNTDEIEQLQREAVEQYWREKGGDQRGRGARYPGR